MRGSSLAWPASLDKLRPFIVTYWSGRTADDAPPEVGAVIDAASYRDKHINFALFALDADGKLLRSMIPTVRPGELAFNPETQGRAFRKQLDEMLDGLKLQTVTATDPPRLALPDACGTEPLSGLRVYLTFAANRLNHYRTPTVEAINVTDKMRTALRYPDEVRTVSADDLRPMLEQMYPPAIMDGHGTCRSIVAELQLKPAESKDGQRRSLLSGNVRIELDNTSRISYEGPLSLVITYAADNPAPQTLRGIGTWYVPKHDMQGRPVEWIKMTAAIESRPE